MRSNARQTLALTVVFGLIAIAVFLAFIAPEEQTLGNYIRLIYIHAAVTWVGMAMFLVSGLLALAYFLGFTVKARSGNKLRDMMSRWSSSSLITALLFWTCSVTLGAFAARLTWGGDWWIEPRLRVAAFILIFGFVVFQIREMISVQTFQVALNISVPLGAFLLLASTGKLVHPNNAFANSDSIAIKLFAFAITLIFAVAAFMITSIFVRYSQEKRARSVLKA